MPFQLDFSKFKGSNRALFVLKMFKNEKQIEKESFVKVQLNQQGKALLIKRHPDYQLPEIDKVIISTVSDEGEIRYESSLTVNAATLERSDDCIFGDGRCEFIINIKEDKNG